MFGIGMTELLLIAGLALIVIGPQKLPHLAKSIGRGLAEFKRATQDLKDSIDLESREIEAKVKQEELLSKGSMKPPESAPEKPEQGAEESEAVAEGGDVPDADPPAAPPLKERKRTWMTETDPALTAGKVQLDVIPKAVKAEEGQEEPADSPTTEDASEEASDSGSSPKVAGDQPDKTGNERHES